MKQYKRSFRFVCKGEERKIVEEMLSLQGFSWEEEDFFSSACRLLEEPFSLGASIAGFLDLFTYRTERPCFRLSPSCLTEGLLCWICAQAPEARQGSLRTLWEKRVLFLETRFHRRVLRHFAEIYSKWVYFKRRPAVLKGSIFLFPADFVILFSLTRLAAVGALLKKIPVSWKYGKKKKTLPLVSLQRELLKNAERLLKPGGVLVYSTCTTNLEENEAQVKFAQEELGLTLEKLSPLPEFVMDEPMLGMDGVWRLSPRIGDTQGFFCRPFTQKNSGRRVLFPRKDNGGSR